MKPSGYFVPKILQILKPHGSLNFFPQILETNDFLFQIIKIGNCSKNQIPSPTLEKTNVGQFSRLGIKFLEIFKVHNHGSKKVKWLPF
jgi:hypothetical protein